MDKHESFQQIIEQDHPVLVDFYATWCGPCQVQLPILKEVAGELGEEARILKIDVDKNPEIAGVYQIRGVPTLMIFRNGKAVWRSSGVKRKEELVGLLRQFGQ